MKEDSFYFILSFLNSFETPGCTDGIVTNEEFINYYSIISATVKDDTYFDLLIRSCFGLSQRNQKH